MTDCKVTCQVCRNDYGRPVVWRWLCVTCAEECQQQHRRDTGHAVDLEITKDGPTLDDLVKFTHRAAKARGW